MRRICAGVAKSGAKAQKMLPDRHGSSRALIQGAGLTAQLAEADPAECWDLRIPLNHSGHVHLRVPLRAKQPPAIIGRFVTSVGTVFADKLAGLPVKSLAASVGGREELMAAEERR